MSYRKKLIEVALPLDAINAESAREKSIRHGHPSTLHLCVRGDVPGGPGSRPLVPVAAQRPCKAIAQPGHARGRPPAAAVPGHGHRDAVAPAAGSPRRASIIGADRQAASVFHSPSELAGLLWANGMRLGLFWLGAGLLIALAYLRHWGPRQAGRHRRGGPRPDRHRPGSGHLPVQHAGQPRHPQACPACDPAPRGRQGHLPDRALRAGQNPLPEPAHHVRLAGLRWLRLDHPERLHGVPWGDREAKPSSLQYRHDHRASQVARLPPAAAAEHPLPADDKDDPPSRLGKGPRRWQRQPVPRPQGEGTAASLHGEELRSGDVNRAGHRGATKRPHQRRRHGSLAAGAARRRSGTPAGRRGRQDRHCENHPVPAVTRAHPHARGFATDRSCCVTRTIPAGRRTSTAVALRFTSPTRSSAACRSRPVITKLNSVSSPARCTSAPSRPWCVCSPCRLARSTSGSNVPARSHAPGWTPSPHPATMLPHE